MTPLDIKKLIAEAINARRRAYAPYSKFKVGAAVLGKDGRVFTGCNVENASYGATVCAERVALFAAVAAGCRKFEAIAIVYDKEALADPCGMCRQVLIEFGSDIAVIRANLKGEFSLTTATALLPGAFSLEPR